MKWFKRFLLGILFLIILIVLFFFYQSRDRFPGYEVDIQYRAESLNPIYVGFDKKLISPTGYDSWFDANKDAQYNAEDGDTIVDLNQNGKFDPIWIAGFQNRRPAQGQLDDLWSRAMVIQNGDFTLAFAVIDAIGFGMDDVIRVRKIVEKESDVDYAIVASTHSHNTPDLLGLWGTSSFKSGVNKEYKELVICQIAKSIIAASRNLKKAKLVITKDESAAEDLVMDTRKPYVFDPTIRIIQVIDIQSDTTIGTLGCWANHPETLWNKNLMLSSDFPHPFREAMENGIIHEDSLILNGVGGISIFANGSIGGLMTTVPDFPIKSRIDGKEYTGATIDKYNAQGKSLAYESLLALKNPTTNDTITEAQLDIRAKTIKLKMDNKLFLLAVGLGVLDRGFSGWKTTRSEIAYWKLGPMSFLHHPAEIYPEIVLGGIEKPDGGDFDVEIQETPPLMDLMEGKYKFVMGLSNDMIGYVIPKTEWDVKAPFTYDNEESPYGEINSIGPETAPTLHKEIKELIKQNP